MVIEEFVYDYERRILFYFIFKFKVIFLMYGKNLGM